MVSEFCDPAPVLQPAWIDLHEEFQMHLSADPSLDRMASRNADLLHHASAPPYDDPLLGIAFDEQVGDDLDDLRTRLVETEDLDRHRIGQFLIENLEHRFPDHLGAEPSHRPIGQIVLSIKRRRGRKNLDDRIE